MGMVFISCMRYADFFVMSEVGRFPRTDEQANPDPSAGMGFAHTAHLVDQARLLTLGQTPVI